jgi:starch-binding outer membrane protein, SusD/RagB family
VVSATDTSLLRSSRIHILIIVPNFRTTPRVQLARCMDGSRLDRAAGVFLRRGAACVAIAMAPCAMMLSACGDVLKVANPGILEEGRLDDPALEPFLVNGAIGEFQFAFVTYAMWSATLADEAFMDHTTPSFRELSLHRFTDLNTSNEAVYAALQRARQSADDAVIRVKHMQGAKAVTSLNVARALIYGGYSYTLLGEGFCEAPINLSAPVASSELLARAIARFDEGITVAKAARDAASAAPNSGTATAAVAAANDLIEMAQVGAARASLKKGDLAKARAYATRVPDGYEKLAYYSANSIRENNPVQMATRATLPFLGMHPVFQGLSDVRVPQPRTARRSQNGNTISPPLRPSMYSGWNPTGPAQDIEITSNIRFASGLEARYIIVEIDGPTTEMLTFVNARRAVAGKAPVNMSGSSLLTEFRVQRAIDFYLTGQRLGDLRRYEAAGTNLFPSGKFPVGADSYGSQHCFIVPLSEKTGNPNW